MQKKIKVLALGAHADDIEFYAGGSLLLDKDKNELLIVVATDGRHGHNELFDNLNQQVVLQRQLEQKDSARILGAKRTINFGFEDSKLELYLPAYKQKLLKLIVEFQPEKIYCFDPEKQYKIHEDYHPDHRALATASLDVILIDSTLPSLGGISRYRPEIFLYNSYQKNHSVEIKSVWQKKYKLLTCFKSQREVLEKQKGSLKSVEEFFKY